jgi:hypothetical protein
MRYAWRPLSAGSPSSCPPTTRSAARFPVRPLQSVLKELEGLGNGAPGLSRCGPNANRHAREVLDIQDSIGSDVLDFLAEIDPDWIDEVANETWHEVGGW